MCFKTPKAPPPPKPQPVPTRQDATLNEASEQRRRSSEQTGVFGNIFTSALGDVGYGQSTRRVATLGGS